MESPLATATRAFSFGFSQQVDGPRGAIAVSYRVEASTFLSRYVVLNNMGVPDVKVLLRSP